MATTMFEEPTLWQLNSHWVTGLLIGLGVHALVGLVAIEYAFHRLSRVRDGDVARDAKFPAFRRRDVQNWSRWKFYPGALLSMPIRLIIMILQGMTLVGFSW